MGSTVRIMNWLCTFLLIAIFGMAGVMKLTPILNAEVHNELKENFHKFVTVPPVSMLHLQPDIYRTVVGVVELLSVSLLACPHTKTQLLGHYTLLVVMLGAVWTHFSAGDTVDKMIPALSCLALLLIRLFTSGRASSVKVKST